MNSYLKELEERVAYESKNKNLFTQVLAHSPYASEHRLDHSRCNRRLEFLGGTILEAVTSEFLYRKYETLPEGDLTKIRASIVYEPTLAYYAGDIELGQYLYLGKGEDATGGRDHSPVVSDTMEALVGAIYLDGGFANAKEFTRRFILSDIEHKQLFYDSKTILQEMVQNRREAPLPYEIIREEGPDHNKSFEVRAKIGDEEVGRGAGRTRRAAEQVAAYNSILKLKVQGAAVEE